MAESNAVDHSDFAFHEVAELLDKVEKLKTDKTQCRDYIRSWHNHNVQTRAAYRDSTTVWQLLRLILPLEDIPRHYNLTRDKLATQLANDITIAFGIAGSARGRRVKDWKGVNGETKVTSGNLGEEVYKMRILE
ncbi:hypothetical protein BDK51DRAFT_27360, partial [Blyttiomyces helicus]